MHAIRRAVVRDENAARRTAGSLPFGIFQVLTDAFGSVMIIFAHVAQPFMGSRVKGTYHILSAQLLSSVGNFRIREQYSD